jgi:hypothetical protein
MSPTKPKMGRPPSEKLRQRIIKLHKDGKTQDEIASAVKRSREGVAYHLRQAGLARQAYRETAPIKNGKRVCARCKKSKSIGSFPSSRDAVCRKCYRDGQKG